MRSWCCFSRASRLMAVMVLTPPLFNHPAYTQIIIIITDRLDKIRYGTCPWLSLTPLGKQRALQHAKRTPLLTTALMYLSICNMKTKKGHIKGWGSTSNNNRTIRSPYHGVAFCIDDEITLDMTLTNIETPSIVLSYQPQSWCSCVGCW